MPATNSRHESGRALLGSSPRAPDASGPGLPPPFGISIRSHGDRQVIVVAGEIDCATAPALQDALHRLLAEGHRNLAVDLDSVTFMDGSVLTFLLTARRDVGARGGSSTILGHNCLLTRLLRATGLTDVLPMN